MCEVLRFWRRRQRQTWLRCLVPDPLNRWRPSSTACCSKGLSVPIALITSPRPAPPHTLRVQATDSDAFVQLIARFRELETATDPGGTHDMQYNQVPLCSILHYNSRAPLCSSALQRMGHGSGYGVGRQRERCIWTWRVPLNPPLHDRTHPPTAHSVPALHCCPQVLQAVMTAQLEGAPGIFREEIDLPDRVVLEALASWKAMVSGLEAAPPAWCWTCSWMLLGIAGSRAAGPLGAVNEESLWGAGPARMGRVCCEMRLQSNCNALH